jgi:oligopeptidase B
MPPVAARIPVERRRHGDTVVDDYGWLADRDDPETLAYLRAENDYTAARLADLAPLRATIFDEIKARILETDLSVPVRKGEWWYFSRTVEGSQYPIRCRRRTEDDGPDAAEEVLLDDNDEAGDSAYFAVGAFAVSPDHRLLAFATDHEGDEHYTIRVKDLTTGARLAEEITDAYDGLAWAADSATFFYTTLDDAHRPYRVWRHRLGTAPADDVVVHQEDDERFWLDVGLSRSGDYVLVRAGSKITAEVLAIPAHDPTATIRTVGGRRDGVDYHVDHQGDRFVIVANDGHVDFALFEAPVADPGPEHWAPVWTPGVGTRVLDVSAFAGHLVVPFRRDGLTGVRVIRTVDGDSHEIAFDEPVYTVETGPNPEYDSVSFRLGYHSLVTPASVYDYDLDGRTLTLKKQQPVLGGYDPDAYESHRDWAVAPDGERVPVSLVHRRGVARNGTAPCVLYGYGAYEASIDPWFSAARLSLLDRGFVFAIAHVRGGGEMGRRWYEEGRLLAKPNTFHDYVAVADHLIGSGWTAADRLVGRGASAGGLTMGAVANMAPDRFRAIVAEVPFVDCVNTILDPSLPLTVVEWEEWGNPIDDADVYRCMKAYTPYENVAAIDYPALLVTAGLNDPRVLYHEPAKWVARLRATASSFRPPGLVLETKLEAGHAGASGRYDAWHEEALVLAFTLAAVGLPAG